MNPKSGTKRLDWTTISALVQASQVADRKKIFLKEEQLEKLEQVNRKKGQNS
jgi:hypothetical protein